MKQCFWTSNSCCYPSYSQGKDLNFLLKDSVRNQRYNVSRKFPTTPYVRYQTSGILQNCPAKGKYLNNRCWILVCAAVYMLNTDIQIMNTNNIKIYTSNQFAYWSHSIGLVILILVIISVRYHCDINIWTNSEIVMKHCLTFIKSMIMIVLIYSHFTCPSPTIWGSYNLTFAS